MRLSIAVITCLATLTLVGCAFDTAGTGEAGGSETANPEDTVSLIELEPANTLPIEGTADRISANGLATQLTIPGNAANAASEGAQPVSAEAQPAGFTRMLECVLPGERCGAELTRCCGVEESIAAGALGEQWRDHVYSTSCRLTLPGEFRCNLSFSTVPLHPTE